jgi:hypothetical protein
MTDKPLKVIQSEKPTRESMIGRCETCQYWIDGAAMEHVQIDLEQQEFNQFQRECWAENPNTVPADRRAKTHAFDLCRHWELRRRPNQPTE